MCFIILKNTNAFAYVINQLLHPMATSPPPPEKKIICLLSLRSFTVLHLLFTFIFFKVNYIIIFIFRKIVCSYV